MNQLGLSNIKIQLEFSEK